VEGVQSLDFLARSVQYTLVDGVGHAVIDQLGQHQAVLAVVEHFECVDGEGEEVSNIGIAGKHSIDVPCEFGALILVDCVCYVCRRALDLNPAPTLTGLLRVAWRRWESDGFGATRRHPFLRRRRGSDFGDELARG
jgi:hypothetical protein